MKPARLMRVEKRLKKKYSRAHAAIDELIDSIRKVGSTSQEKQQAYDGLMSSLPPPAPQREEEDEDVPRTPPRDLSYSTPTVPTLTSSRRRAPCRSGRSRRSFRFCSTTPTSGTRRSRPLKPRR